MFTGQQCAGHWPFCSKFHLMENLVLSNQRSGYNFWSISKQFTFIYLLTSCWIFVCLHFWKFVFKPSLTLKLILIFLWLWNVLFFIIHFTCERIAQIAKLCWSYMHLFCFVFVFLQKFSLIIFILLLLYQF